MPLDCCVASDHLAQLERAQQPALVRRCPLLSPSETVEGMRGMYHAGRALPWETNPAALDAIEAPEARNLVAGLLRCAHGSSHCSGLSCSPACSRQTCVLTWHGPASCFSAAPGRRIERAGWLGCSTYRGPHIFIPSQSVAIRSTPTRLGAACVGGSQSSA